MITFGASPHGARARIDSHCNLEILHTFTDADRASRRQFIELTSNSLASDPQKSHSLLEIDMEYDTLGHDLFRQQSFVELDLGADPSILKGQLELAQELPEIVRKENPVWRLYRVLVLPGTIELSYTNFGYIGPPNLTVTVPTQSLDIGHWFTITDPATGHKFDFESSLGQTTIICQEPDIIHRIRLEPTAIRATYCFRCDYCENHGCSRRLYRDRPGSEALDLITKTLDGHKNGLYSYAI